MTEVTIMDGPLGTELNARGVATNLPLWSASAIDSAADTIAAIHRDYATAGATLHTANTFRTKRRTTADWQRLAREAIQIARHALPHSHRLAGSIAPLEDCYRPDLSPGQSSRKEHRELAELLADEDCDLLLCETFPNVEEAIVAVEEAVQTGVETWAAFTSGPKADLMAPATMASGAKRAVDAGASAVLVNCTPAANTLPFVQALSDARLNVPIGAYANAGRPHERIGWQSPSQPAAAAYVNFARGWIAAGATIVGGCCGTSPVHIKAMREMLGAG